MDILTKERRSWNMSRIRGENTTPERIVRSVLHRLGARFRLHRKDLPGSPDIVLSKHRLCVFVHGCFWHRHPHCKYAYTPKSRVRFWMRKFEQNIERDRRAKSRLRRLGWRVIMVWECQTVHHDKLVRMMLRTIESHHVDPKRKVSHARA